MKKCFQRIGCILLVMLFAFSGIDMALAQTAEIREVRYLIENPYEEVDWDTYGAYKACTHCHTTRSDGEESPSTMVERYYELGYDILALTDHGTVSASWTTKQDRLALYFWNKATHKDVVSEQRAAEIAAGTDRGGRGMVQLPMGNELNSGSLNKCHVNSYFANCGQGDTDVLQYWPEDAVKTCQNAGGLCHINHVGDWSGGDDDISRYDADFMERYAGIFLNYPAAVGMEVVNHIDTVTCNDRYLYDLTLQITAPQGRNVFAFCEDDSHLTESCGNNANIFLMAENTPENMRRCMESGAFFACSRYSQGEKYLADAVGTGDFPTATRITVDDAAGTITVVTAGADRICMVSDGQWLEDRQISEGEILTFTLDDYGDTLGSYVRFYLTGVGGICYIQPFLLCAVEQTMTLTDGNLGGSWTLLLPAAQSIDSAEGLLACYCDGKFCGCRQTEVQKRGKLWYVQLENPDFFVGTEDHLTLRLFLLNKSGYYPVCAEWECYPLENE